MYNRGYKDFNLYIEGLNKLYNYVNKINNYTIRLFIDNTIFKDKVVVNVLDNISMVFLWIETFLTLVVLSP
jgi:hypothetical protein